MDFNEANRHLGNDPFGFAPDGTFLQRGDVREYRPVGHGPVDPRTGCPKVVNVGGTQPYIAIYAGERLVERLYP